MNLKNIIIKRLHLLWSLLLCLSDRVYHSQKLRMEINNFKLAYQLILFEGIRLHNVKKKILPNVIIVIIKNICCPPV